MKNLLIKTFLFVFLLSSFILIGFNFSLQKAHACSCIQQSVEEKAELSDVVFIGEATKEISPEGYVPPLLGMDEMMEDFYKEYTVVVEKVYKGDLTLNESINISTGLNSAMCGVNFELGEKYLIYANYDNNGNLYTNLCNGTVDINNSNKDTDYLNNNYYHPMMWPNTAMAANTFNFLNLLVIALIFTFIVALFAIFVALVIYFTKKENTSKKA